MIYTFLIALTGLTFLFFQSSGVIAADKPLENKDEVASSSAKGRELTAEEIEYACKFSEEFLENIKRNKESIDLLKEMGVEEGLIDYGFKEIKSEIESVREKNLEQ